MSTTSRASRTAIVLVALVCSVQLGGRPAHGVVLVLVLLAALALGVGAAWGRLGPLEPLLGRVSTLTLARLTVTMVAVLSGIQITQYVALAHSAPLAGGTGALVVAAAATAAWATGGRGELAAFTALLVAVAGSMVLLIYGFHPVIDVESMLRESGRHLLHLESPYGGSTLNVYSPEDTARFYSPELVDGDRITLGYAYLPASLVLGIAGNLVGDVRIAALACVLASAAIIRRLATDPTGRALAVMLAASPLTVAIVANFWVEPVVVLFLTLAVLGLREDRPVLAAVGTGLLFASKQYLIVAAPVLLVLRRVRGGAVATGSVAVAAACCAPFLLAGPSAFVSDVVRAQLLQPYRPDSVSLLVVLGNAIGQPPGWITGPLPLLAGLAVSTLVVRRSRLDPATALAATVGLSLFATVLLSKQAFANYYFVVAAALLVAAVTWPGSRRASEERQAEVGSATPASTMRTESSMPGRGE